MLHQDGLRCNQNLLIWSLMRIEPHSLETKSSMMLLYLMLVSVVTGNHDSRPITLCTKWPYIMVGWTAPAFLDTMKSNPARAPSWNSSHCIIIVV